ISISVFISDFVICVVSSKITGNVPRLCAGRVFFTKIVLLKEIISHFLHFSTEDEIPAWRKGVITQRFYFISYSIFSIGLISNRCFPFPKSVDFQNEYEELVFFIIVKL